nr:CHASE domain-containing protein [Parvularcula dongshanensis]
MRGGAGYFAATDGEITEDEFAAYVNRLRFEDTYPGAQGLGYARVTGVQPSGRLTSEIVFLEPKEGRNESAIGYDMLSEPVRRGAMQRARDLGVASMTGPLNQVQTDAGTLRAGFIIYVPVYTTPGVPSSLDARRATIRGWVYSALRANAFFGEGVLRGRPPREVAFAVYDASQQEVPIFAYGARAPWAATTVRRLEVGGREWLVAFAATRDFQRKAGRPFLATIALIGFTVTVLLARAADAQVRAAREAVTAREALEEETVRLDALRRASAALAAELDLRRLVELVVDEAQTLTRAAYGAFFERAVSQDGEPIWRLYSLSGAKREDFVRFGTPRVTDLLAPSFERGETVRSDDVLTDARYGRMGGMPKGHLPVRSYLSTPVVSSSGQVFGALLFGHPEPARFGHREEELITAFAAQAATALDNAQLFRDAQEEIARRKRAEIELQDERRAAEIEAAERAAILGQLGEGVIVTDASGRITFVNDAAARLHGVSELNVGPEGYVSTYGILTLDGRPYSSEEMPLTRAARYGESIADARWRIRQPNGTEVLAIGSAQPITAASGQRIGAVLTLRDDTERHAAEESLRAWSERLEERVKARTAELERARDSLEMINRDLEAIVEARVADVKSANEEVQRFAYIVSHDLRAPLVNIMGFAGELETSFAEVQDTLPKADADSFGADVKESLDFIRAAISKMDGLINAILKLSREGQRRYTPVPLDMTTLVRTAIATLHHQAGEVGAEMSVEALPDITSDRLAVEQIFANLLDNALKYLDADRRGKIDVSGRIDGSFAVFEVTDNGRGIDPKDHARVFDLFRRSGRPEKPGEGIGLAYVRMLVRALGGRISLSSEPGVGTTFTVRLPLEFAGATSQ